MNVSVHLILASYGTGASPPSAQQGFFLAMPTPVYYSAASGVQAVVYTAVRTN